MPVSHVFKLFFVVVATMIAAQCPMMKMKGPGYDEK
jgi:hypothetical protein